MDLSTWILSIRIYQDDPHQQSLELESGIHYSVLSYRQVYFELKGKMGQPKAFRT